MYEYSAKVDRVVDGDTVDLHVDLGFGITIKERFRLYGINAPETRTRDQDEKIRGMEAKKWLADKLHNSNNLRIRTVKDKKGKFGRYLCTLILHDQDGGIDLNKEMVELKLAKEYML